MTWFTQLDLSLLHQINSVWTAPILDKIMAAISSFDLFRIPLAVAVVLLLILGKFRERAFLIVMALCILIGDAGVGRALKSITHRARPHEAMENIRVVDLEGVHYSVLVSNPKGRSFPSQHACNNLALAIVAYAFYRRYALFLFAWAFLVSYSRIYVGSHYPSDVLASCIIATIYTLLILMTCSWLWEKIGPRLMPKIYQRHPELLMQQSND
jgi:undecaprenyl-diphosphatase